MLITGAGSGIGRATAHLFADYGAYVAVTDIDPQRVAGVVEEINQSGGKSKGWELDVTCLLYTSPSPRDLSTSRMPSSA